MALVVSLGPTVQVYIFGKLFTSQSREVSRVVVAHLTTRSIWISEYTGSNPANFIEQLFTVN